MKVKKLSLLLFLVMGVAGCGGSPEDELENCYFQDPTSKQEKACMEALFKKCVECCMDSEIWPGEEGSFAGPGDKETCELQCEYDEENTGVWRYREYTSDICSGPQITFE